ncbi:MAG TPA: wax ester/triacylglycerol synthase family O-acyltransferase [Rubricoccaceae bacterium]
MTPPRPFPMSTPDSAWVRMEDLTNPMTITGLIGFGARIPRADFERFWDERIVPFDRFRMRVEGAASASPRWVPEPDYATAHHFHDADLPAPADREALQALVSRLMSEPLSFERSPWSVHYVPEVTNDDGTVGSAAVVRLHHCIGDGIALMHVVLSAADEMFSTDSLPASRPKRALVPVRERSLATLSGALAETRDLLLRPAHLAERLTAAASGAKAAVGLLAMRPDSDTVFKGDASADKRAAWTHVFPLARVRGVAEASGTKINDVLMAAATGGLRRYLLDAGEPVEGVGVRAAVPVNVRPLDRASELGNSFGLAFLLLPVALESPGERLAEVKRRMDALKGSAQPGLVFLILQSIGRAPRWLHTQVVDMFSQKASIVMTNVPGPTSEIHMGGGAVRSLMFWVPQAGDIGLGLSILSYNGEVRVGICADAAYVADPNRLVAAFEAEFEALAQHVVRA